MRNTEDEYINAAREKSEELEKLVLADREAMKIQNTESALLVE